MKRVGLGSLLCSLLFGSGCLTSESLTHTDPVRAIWVTRFDYRNARDIETIMRTCAGAGFNTVLFQVRGNGTVFYDSKLEPWADELGGRNPGFDPLRLACELAEQRNLELHAWVNVLPSWRGKQAPTNPEQLYNRRPEWHWYDARGERQPTVEKFYTSLNPCLPEVRTYLVELFRELVSNYDLDGLHLDYIRFVDDLAPEGRDYPRDARTLELYRRATGRAPDEDADLWKRWRAEQVTQLLRSIRAMTRAVAPGLQLSAAVGAEPGGPTDRHLRDSRRWAEEELLDAIFPMNYTADPREFARRVNSWSQVDTPIRIVTGIMVNPADRSLNDMLAEVRAALGKSPHLCFFSYSYLFGPRGEPRDPALVRALRSLVTGPDS